MDGANPVCFFVMLSKFLEHVRATDEVTFAYKIVADVRESWNPLASACATGNFESVHKSQESAPGGNTRAKERWLKQ